MSDQFELSDVHCDVFLSKVMGEIGLAVFKLSCDREPTNMAWPFEFSFSGKVQITGGELNRKVNMIKLYRKSTSSSRGEAYKWMVSADIGEYLIDDPELCGRCENVTGRYLLSPSDFLCPVKWLDPLYTGEVKFSHPPQFFSFTLCDGLNIKFDNHYMSEVRGDGFITMEPYLVGEFELESEAQGYEPSFQNMDDFLMLVSFASRQRSVCLGWEMQTSSLMKEKRRWVSISERVERAVEPLISFGEFELFIGSAYEVFQSCKHKTLLREVISGVLVEEKYMLSNFLRLYAALETLILIFRKDRGLDYILDNYSPLKKELKKSIKNIMPSEGESESRRLLYNNLSGLNRVPFSEAFGRFKREYNLDLSDLWSVDCGKGGLSDIRNRLVHGSRFEEYENKALVIATYHLAFVLERCLLAFFGWEKLKDRTRSYMPQRDYDAFMSMTKAK